MFEQIKKELERLKSGKEQDFRFMEIVLDKLEQQYENKIGNYEDELVDHQSAISDLEDEIRTVDLELSNYKEKLEDQKNVIPSLEKEINSLNITIAAYKKKLEDKSEKILDLQAQMRNLVTQLYILEEKK